MSNDELALNKWKNRKPHQRNRRLKEKTNGNLELKNSVANKKLSRWTQKQKGADRGRISELEDRSDPQKA